MHHAKAGDDDHGPFWMRMLAYLTALLMQIVTTFWGDEDREQNMSKPASRMTSDWASVVFKTCEAAQCIATASKGSLQAYVHGIRCG